MAENELNSAPILDQLRGHWQKVAALLLWKLAKREAVRISVTDIEEFARTEEGDGAVLITMGHFDGFTLRIATKAEGETVIAHQQTLRGSA